jgi:uncharacterized protein
MKIVVTGGTGFVGRALVTALAARGDDVVVLSRGEETELPASVVAWDPKRSGAWQRAIDGVDAVVHLAGSPVAVRWTEASKREVLDSRVVSAERLVEAIGAAGEKPAVFVSASATGYYGAHRPGETLTEASAPGDDFLADVCLRWEAAADEASAHGLRVVKLRLGIVLGPVLPSGSVKPTPGGGALAQMLLPGKAGVTRVGSGNNDMSWIHRDDVVSMILWAIDGDRTGAYNCTAPSPESARAVAAAIGRAISRPVIPTPVFAVKMILGAAADVVVGSLRVLPERALAEGFSFAHPDLEGCLGAIFSP